MGSSTSVDHGMPARLRSFRRSARTLLESYLKEMTSAAGCAGVRFVGGGFMIEPRTSQERGLRPGHKLTIVAAVVVAALVAYVALGFLASLVAVLIKTVIVLVVIGGVLYLVFRHAGRRRL
jgi:hypothetical protein